MSRTFHHSHDDAWPVAIRLKPFDFGHQAFVRLSMASRPRPSKGKGRGKKTLAKCVEEMKGKVEPVNEPRKDSGVPVCVDISYDEGKSVASTAAETKERKEQRTRRELAEKIKRVKEKMLHGVDAVVLATR